MEQGINPDFRKVIVVSDSHGNLGVLRKILIKEMPFDLWIHLGDGIAEIELLRGKYGFNLEGIRGNNDPAGWYPETTVLKIGPERFFATHGHLYGVETSLADLAGQARREGCRFVLFGHTHQFVDTTIHRIRILNPGSVCSHLTRPPGYLQIRAEGKKIEAVRRLFD